MDNFIKAKIQFNQGATENLIHIGYGIDDNYCRPMGVSIASICRHNPHNNFCFHVMTTGLLKGNLDKLAVLAKTYKTRIIVYDLDVSLLANLPTQQHLPLPTYFRFLLPLILKEEQRLYYIDADIVCLNNLQELWDTDFKAAIIMGVKDLPWMAAKREKALGLAPNSYFNAGMLVINLPLWRQFDTFTKVMAAIRENPSLFRYLDQDGLNLILNGKVKYLPDKFNCLALGERQLEEINLLHFAAHPKPWHKAYAISKAGKALDQSIYLDIEQTTPWCDSPLDLPRNSKEYRMYAKALWAKGEYWQALQYYYKYFQAK